MLFIYLKAPQLAEPWTGTYDATVQGSHCPQQDLMSGKFTGSEDCLFLNVFTKKVRISHTEENSYSCSSLYGSLMFKVDSNRIYNPILSTAFKVYNRPTTKKGYNISRFIFDDWIQLNSCLKLPRSWRLWWCGSTEAATKEGLRVRSCTAPITSSLKMLSWLPSTIGWDF